MLKRFLRQRALRNQKQSAGNSNSQDKPPSNLKRNLQANLDSIKDAFSDSFDLRWRSFELGGREALLVYIRGLISREQIQNFVLRSMQNAAVSRPEIYQLSLEEAAAKVLPMAEVKTATTLDDVIDGLVNGAAVWLLDGHEEALVIFARGWAARQVSTSESEAVVRGPREGLTENLGDNLSLLRRRLRTPKLVVESLKLGKVSQTPVCMVYIKGICRGELVEEVRLRIKGISIDAVLDTNYIEEFIQDNPYTPFPLVGNVEKPDTLAAKLLEGRVGIMVDGTPIALTVPKLFIESFQTPDDYYSRFFNATFMRWLRYTSFFISVALPAFFVAIMNYHQEMVPTSLLITVAASREGTPFPAIFEIIMMLLMIYIVVEATARMPKVLGQTVSIVGTLVIGQAAISAGLVGAPVVIVVTVAALTAFPVLPLLGAGTVTRFCLLLGAAFLGLYGMVMVALIFVVHLCSLESFKVPYLFPVTPLSTRGLKDTLFRAPWPLLRTRPWPLAPDNVARQPNEKKGSFQDKRGRKY